MARTCRKASGAGKFPHLPYPVRVTVARRSLWLALAACGLALSYVSTAASDGGTTTTAPPATTAAVTTTTVTTPPAPPTTTAQTTTAPAGTPVRPVARELDRGCLVVGIAALRLPGHALPLVLGPVAHAPWAKTPSQLDLAYPADGSVLSARSASITAPQCGDGSAAAGISTIKGLSLFDGAITADAVTLRINGGDLGSDAVVTGLRVDGVPEATPPVGRRLPIGSWAYLEVFRSNSVKVRHSPRLRASGLVLHMLTRRAGVPAGTEIQVTFADLAVPPPPPPVTTTSTATTTTTTTTTVAAPATPPPSHPVTRHTPHHTVRKATRQQRPSGAPLAVTPRLGRQTFVFPVEGQASYGDTYGAFRSDVPGGWHHGDDIFAALGTPVVAVATGTLNRVGWEKLGGWRLWVRDKSGDEFYYAHLSGYAPAALRSKHVKAGEIIGFVGNSGDAYPLTPPHLHFEVHPRTLLHLQYNGAVDPTTYLEGWPRPDHVFAPHPVLPRIASLPTAQVKKEARAIFRELLSDRGLLKRARPTKPPTPVRVAPSLEPRLPVSSATRAAPVLAHTGNPFDAAPLMFVLFGSVALLGAGAVYWRRGKSGAAAALLNALDAADELD